jgi:hypothetical protein
MSGTGVPPVDHAQDARATVQPAVPFVVNYLAHEVLPYL